MVENYTKLQEDIAVKLEKAFTNFKKAPKDRITISYLDTRLEALKENWSVFLANHRKLVFECKKEELDKTNYVTSEVYDLTEETYMSYKSLLRERLSQLRVSNESTSKSNDRFNCGTSDSIVKLPRISIPRFTGKYSEWASFRDLFKSLIHKNTSLDDVQKLHYLKCSVSDEAENLLRHIPVTAENYKICWLKLEDRYNNKRYLANCILTKLTSQKCMTSETHSGIKNLCDTTKECLEALKTLGIDIRTWDVLVIHLISAKLDINTRSKWEEKVSELGDGLPTFEQFEKFLEFKFRSLEAIDQKLYKGQLHSKPSSTLQCKSGSTAHLATSISPPCVYCKEAHKLCNCKEFAKLDTNERRNFVQTSHLCFNCLGSDHSVYQCRVSTKCRICKKRHHSLLHPKSPSQPVESKVVAAVTDQEVIEDAAASDHPTDDDDDPTDGVYLQSPSVVTTCLSKTVSHVLLATALVNVQAQQASSEVDTSSNVLRALLDQGSQASFITESAVQLLGLKKVSDPNVVSGLGGDSATFSSKSSVLIIIQSRLDPTFNIKVKAYVLPKLTTSLPQKRTVVVSLPPLSSRELADPSYNIPNKIDLLLGAEVYCQILMDGLINGPPGCVVAQNTKLGWILSGRILGEPTKCIKKVTCNLVSLHSVEHQVHINELHTRFWELEAEPYSIKPKIPTEEAQKCEEFFKATTKRDETGRYIVRLPFKGTDPASKYAGSKNIAIRRFLNLEKSLNKNPTLKAEYQSVIHEYIALGHMEACVEKSGTVYLPHHAVVRQDKTTSKVRVVFDASCKGINGASLNSDLLVGPTLQPELRHIIMKWRCYPISLVADIVKMYRQVKINDKDVDFQRIVWRDNPDEQLSHYRILRVTFGTSSAPYLAVRALQQLSQDHGAEFPLAAQRVLDHFYMDDLMTGCYSVAEGIEIYNQMTELLLRGGFPLQKWSSNSKELMNQITPNPIHGSCESEIKADNIVKILGLKWNNAQDEFRVLVDIPPVSGSVTKRNVISEVARLFDPLGWIAPTITTAKIFIQRIWLSGIEWDDVLPTTLLNDWIQFRSELPILTKYRIPRWMHSQLDDKVIEIHGFSDASNLAYAAVVYARIVDSEGHIHVSLITSKTRVAPIKQVSIPRLELCGAVLLSKLLREVSEVLCVPKQKVHAWTDSTIVLAWLSSHPSRWKTFIANRTSSILSILDRNQWSHVTSEKNPADPASRGLSPSEFVDNRLWIEGPDWLHLKKIKYGYETSQDTNLEEKKVNIKCHVTCDQLADADDPLSKYSSLKKLTRVVATCRKWLKKKKDSTDLETKGRLTANDLKEAMISTIKWCQKNHFMQDIEQLQANKCLTKKSKLTSLNPFLDRDGLLRVGGRLDNAGIADETKHPVIIPHKSHFTNLLIDEAHTRTMHGGPQLMLNYLRTKYWVIGAKVLVRGHVRKCVTCLRYSGQPAQQLMGQLPTSRVSAHRPFYRSGVDYAGPINVRSTKGRGYRSTNGYICLFVCMATKAIHLEMVSDLTTQSFLAAFKRFTARRGHVAELWSDNGTTFIGGSRELIDLFVEERSRVAVEIADWLSSNGTTWRFIPPYSPNFGGLWESGVKSTKHHLRRVIGTHTLTFEEMITTLTQIEACLNSRPICQLSNNSDDPAALTPGHFLVGEPLVLVPDSNYENSNISCLKRWHLTQRIVQDYWRRWSQEYLTTLHHRYKWQNQVAEPKVGDLVLVKEDNLPPARWLYGLVHEKHNGLDGLTRVVTLKYKGKFIKRPVSKIIILPIDAHNANVN